MTHVKRGSGSHRWVYLCAAAALGFALSGCNGASGSSSAAVSTAQSSTAIQQPTTPQGSTAIPSPAATSSSTTTTSSSTAGSGTSSTSTSAGSTSSNPPTATAGNVTLNWVPPTENVDGTALTDLAGYDIHYGTASGQYTQTISVSNPGLATYVVSNLTPGTYYFTVAAVNSQGTESPLSSEVSTIVN